MGRWHRYRNGDHSGEARCLGLHRHLALVMLTYSFLMQQRGLASQGSEGGLSPPHNSPDAPSNTPPGAAVSGAGSDHVAR